jgi:SAM-dependent methyltransferase
VLGELYEAALAGVVQAEVEHDDGTRMPLAVDRWLDAVPGDKSLVDRCHGPTLDVGSGPGRLTVALAERGVPALGIDITPFAVGLARSAGALALLRDVFDRVPGAGRWMTVLLADGNIGIGGNPAALLQRVNELLAPGGHALVEVQPPGVPLRCERVRLRREGITGAWFPWAYVGADQIGGIARSAGLAPKQTWAASGRWFAELVARGGA